MDEDIPPEASPENPTARQLRALTTLADFDAVDFEAPIRGLGSCYPLDLSMAYDRAFQPMRDAGNEPAQVVFWLFYHLCSCQLRVSDRSDVWGPIGSGPNGRTAIPEDFRGEQTAILAAVVPRIVNPGLRARIADVAWSNNRRDGKSAVAAIYAYCDVVEGFLAGTWNHQHDRNAASASIKFIHRASQIGHATSKRGTLPARVRTVFDQMYLGSRRAGCLEFQRAGRYRDVIQRPTAGRGRSRTGESRRQLSARYIPDGCEGRMGSGSTPI
jgi:hypothetical protein